MNGKQNSNLAKTVGANIVRRRKELGISQESLAEQLNITNSALSRIENGSAAPRFSRLEVLANILHCHVVDLFRSPSDPLCVHLDMLADLLKPYPQETQEELVSMLANTLEVFGKLNQHGRFD